MKRRLRIGILVIIMLTFASIAAAQGGNLPAGSYQLVLVNGVVHPSPIIAAKIGSAVTNASESRGGSVPGWMGREDFGDLRAWIGQVGTQFDSLVHNGMPVSMADGIIKYDYYNGFSEQDNRQGFYGADSLGLENVKLYIILDVLDGSYEVPHGRHAGRARQTGHLRSRHQGRRCAALQPRLVETVEGSQHLQYQSSG